MVKYFAVVESMDNGSKGLIECLREDCKSRNSKPRTFNAKQGWSSHILHLETQHKISKDSFLKSSESKSMVSFIVKTRKMEKVSNSGTYKWTDLKQVQFLTNLMDLVCISGIPLTLIHHPVMMKFVHFLDDNWKLKTFCLGFREFDGQKNADAIRNTFLHEVGIRYKIQPEQVGFIMADNARENVCAFGSSNVFLDEDDADDEEQLTDDDDPENIDWVNCVDYQQDDLIGVQMGDDDDAVFAETSKWASRDLIRLGCVSHALQLVIKECLSKNPQCKEIQAQLDHLTAFFNRSNQWHVKLIKKAKKGLIKVGDTRWNSFLLAVDRILDNDFVVNLNSVLEEAHTMNTGRAAVPDLITPEREIELRDICELLTPFLKLTKQLEGDGVTSSLVILGIITLYKQVAAVECKTEYMRAFKTSLCLTLTERFGAKEQFHYAGRGAKKNLLRVFENQAYIMATILDPRWKLAPFEIPLHEPYLLSKYVTPIDKVKKLITREYRKEKGESDFEKDTIACDDDSGGNIPEKLMRTDFLSSFIPNNTHDVAQNVSNEVEEYLNEIRCSGSVDPLEYWRANSTKLRFPVLCRLARKYLAFLATSSSMERVFSIAGSFNRARRARLAPKTMENFLIYREFWREQLQV
ncbi:unnamed protein product [Allacma fusca]|uniref:HAT C-terminal dimerisation domain-containing protein n=1 Tax=Allacma fusca TaxID=39272 RepID=A0A8J2JLB2_9HEXA|nr:unnamed protein product [Allacma fusca]